MQTEKCQPEGKRIMPETRLTEFPVLSVDPRDGIFRSAPETDFELFFTDTKNYPSFLDIFDILRRIMTFLPNVIRCFLRWCKSDVTSKI